ncbi:hypothetical protein [Lichenifustis flavocetrariae]|uniref:Uncharacterized protein n=1 Tax=Lichenifustis flavocetrariae TaxID=2949735 RepID=A0AA41Z208_9HYPH|nr:hypothetical protein [Lichenifustis flavocetrariae]MCW6511527.1 hypothetical protein [Lichenifustis flavocetrariae]
MDASKLCVRAKLQLSTLQRAENTDSTPPITIAQAANIQAVCEAAGVVFDPGGIGVRLQRDPE